MMRRPLLVLAWFVFLFLLLEAAGYLYFRLEVSKPISGYGYPAGLLVAHPELDYLYRPHFSGHFKGSAYQDIPIVINSRGFRDNEFAEIAPDAFRLAVLGDSVVFGAGVRAEDRFTECLDPMREGEKERWKTLNMGVNAYSFGHYLKLAELDFLGTRPDAVLFGITLNDFALMEGSGPAKRLRRHTGQLHKPDWMTRAQERIDRTYAALFLQELKTRFTYAAMNADQREEYHTKWMRSVVDGWLSEGNRRRFEDDLDRLRRVMEKADIPYAFILFPELNEVRDSGEFGAPRTILRELLDRRGLQYCDPRDALAQEDDLSSLFLARDSIHYTREGHKRICEALARCIERGDISLKPAS